MTSPTTNQNNVQEQIPPCPLNTIIPLSTLSRRGHSFEGTSPLWSPLPSKAIKLCFSISPQILSLCFYLALVSRDCVSVILSGSQICRLISSGPIVWPQLPTFQIYFTLILCMLFDSTYISMYISHFPTPGNSAPISTCSSTIHFYSIHWELWTMIPVVKKKKSLWEFLLWLSGLIIQLLSLWGCGFNPWPHSVSQGSGIAVSCSIGHKRGSDPVLPCLLHRPTTAAPIWLLVQVL